jgi:alkylhydroperoxidase/carboxymuconolactone decarboxylase family protein YurZ
MGVNGDGANSEMYESGLALAQQLLGSDQGELEGIQFADPDDDWTREHVSWLFGYLLQDGPDLPLRTKLLAAVAMATALREPDTIDRWVVAAKRYGLTREEVQEAALTTLIYGGLPGTRLTLQAIERAWAAA